MQLEATTQDLMGHKTIKSKHFLFEPKRPEHSKVKVWDSALTWPPIKVQVERIAEEHKEPYRPQWTELRCRWEL